MGKEIKGNRKQRLENALETLDLVDLESIFFDKKFNFNIDDYDTEFEIQNIESLSKDELAKIIKRNKPTSLWEKEISKYAAIDNAQDRMEKIRRLRNSIAHNKTFTDKNFKTLKKELDFIIPKLNEAEDKILNTHDSEVLELTLKRISERIKEATTIPILRELENLGTSISESVKQVTPVIPKEFFKILQDVTNPLSNFKLPDIYKETKEDSDEDED